MHSHRYRVGRLWRCPVACGKLTEEKTLLFGARSLELYLVDMCRPVTPSYERGDS